MGWASTGDPLSNLQMEFSSAQAAINYCAKYGEDLLEYPGVKSSSTVGAVKSWSNCTPYKPFRNHLTRDMIYPFSPGFEYEVIEPKKVSKKKKSYAQNFAWSSHTRIVTK